MEMAVVAAAAGSGTDANFLKKRERAPEKTHGLCNRNICTESEREQLN